MILRSSIAVKKRIGTSAVQFRAVSEWWRSGQFLHSESVIMKTSGNRLNGLVWSNCKTCRIVIGLWLSVIKSGYNRSANEIQSSELEPVIPLTRVPLVHMTVLRVAMKKSKYFVFPYFVSVLLGSCYLCRTLFFVYIVTFPVFDD
jgi:hypothetical protein